MTADSSVMVVVQVPSASAVVDPVEISIGDGEVSSSMNVDTDERASAVPLSTVGNVFVGDVIAVTVGTSGFV